MCCLRRKNSLKGKMSKMGFGRIKEATWRGALGALWAMKETVWKLEASEDARADASQGGPGERAKMPPEGRRLQRGQQQQLAPVEEQILRKEDDA